MKTHSEEAIHAALDRIWTDDRLDDEDIKVELNEPEHVRVSLSSMYEAPGLSLAKLLQVAEFFDTKNISDPDYELLQTATLLVPRPLFLQPIRYMSHSPYAL